MAFARSGFATVARSGVDDFGLNFDGGDGRSFRSFFFLSGDKVGGSGESDESDESEEQFLSHGKNSKVLKGGKIATA